MRGAWSSAARGPRRQPLPLPAPLCQKGLITLGGRRKPAFAAVATAFARIARLHPDPCGAQRGAAARRARAVSASSA
jgi:hypothetical protein